MELELKRTYLTGGTNGELFFNKRKICYTIELPWKSNQNRVSCIPEGRYRAVGRYTRKFGHHLWLQAVSNRSMILIHPANDALIELKGCIAPVTTITGEGKGSSSRVALKKLIDAINKNGIHSEIFITIGKA